mmetsp:Transcript_8521/g.12364  ORF Transcript_8521/g.12364 Transcript_8521/m.12364 type:complete len:83 (+) Transcript_8521:1482-1730(+)
MSWLEKLSIYVCHPKHNIHTNKTNTWFQKGLKNRPIETKKGGHNLPHIFSLSSNGTINAISFISSICRIDMLSSSSSSFLLS